MKSDQEEGQQAEHDGEPPAAAEGVDGRPTDPAAEADAEDLEVPPSGALPPDPTGLGALA